MNEDRNTPATKGDLLDLREEVVDLKVEVNTQFESLKDDLIEAIRDGQTEVLRAFYGF